MPYDFDAYTYIKKKATETGMCRDRDRDVQRQRQRERDTERESGYMWMCKAGQGNDWTGVQRSGMELTKFFFDGPSSFETNLTDQSALIHFIIIICNTFWTLTLTFKCP